MTLLNYSGPFFDLEEDGVNGTEMWLACTNCRVDLLLATEGGWMQHHQMTLHVTATAACAVENHIWIGDEAGDLHAYS